MGLLPSSQRDQTKVAIAVVALALAGYYYAYPYTAQAAELDAVREHIDALESQNAKARVQASRRDVETLKAEAARAGAGLEAMQRLVPTEHEVPALLEEISTAARRAGLEIAGVTPEPVLRGDELDTYRYRISATGGYHALAHFLANVGSLPRIVAPVTFTLAMTNEAAAKGATGKAAPLAASVTLQAFVAHAPVPGAGRDSSEHAETRAGETIP